MTREEAIEVYNGLLNEKIKEAFEFFAPELAESEDERMLREIKRYIKEQGNKPTGLPNGTVAVADMIAWLEKQKENIEKEYVFRPLAGTDITIAAEQAIRRVNEGDRLVLAFNGAYIPVRKGCNANKIVDIYDAFIEKQKEQTEELSIRLNGLMQEYVKAGKDEEEQEHRLKCYQLFWDALEDSEFFEQKEQKHTLKFKVGDKVHLEGDEINILTITGIEKDRYLTDNSYGPILFGAEDIWQIVEQKEQKHPDGCFSCDEYKKGYEAGRLNGFTAGYNKAMKEQKLVKKEITLTDFEKVLNTFLFDFANSPIEDCEPKEYIKKYSAEILKAAYKELNAQLQQDIFEAKQEGRYEGYEAAKAEQKPTEWSEDYNEENIQTRFAFYTYKDDPSTLYLSNVFVEEASRNHGFGTRILRAAEKVAETIGATTISLKVKQDSPANVWYRKNGYSYVAFEDGYDWLEKNLEYFKLKKEVGWNEEEMKLLDSIIDDYEKASKSFCDYDGKIGLLRAIRDSEYDLSKQEWSEKDQKALDISCFIIGSIDIYHDPILRQKCLDFLYELPKRFALSPKQEWSEEDENKRTDAINFLKCSESHYVKPENISKIVATIDWLKSLRPSWKPSEEDLKDLLRLKDSMPDNDWGNQMEGFLEDLIGNLKKL